MGAKTWMLVYADGNARDALASRPALDRDATAQFISELFPDETIEPREDGTLSYTSPPDDEIFAGVFPGVSVIAAKEFGIDYPSQLEPRFLHAAHGRTVSLHAMHSVVDWFAYAQWVDGTLMRALSLSPDSGILEDIGVRMPFEEPYWAGQHPAVDGEEEADDYPFPFHPLELGEAALSALFGYQLEGPLDQSLFDAESVPLLHFKRVPQRSAKPRWKFW